MSHHESFEDIMAQIAELAARASHQTTHAAIDEIRKESAFLMARLMEASKIAGRNFGEIAEAMQREPWVNRMLGALCEAQVREPLTECHHIPVLLRNASQVVLDALEQDPERIHDPLVADQFRTGKRLARIFTVRFLASDISKLRGGIDATTAQRIALLANMAFLQQPAIASADPIRELLAELVAAGVPDADRVSEDGIGHPLASE